MITGSSAFNGYDIPDFWDNEGDFACSECGDMFFRDEVQETVDCKYICIDCLESQNDESIDEIEEEE